MTDIPGDTSTEATLGPDRFTFGTFEVSGDNDLYRFNAEAGLAYGFIVSGTGGPNSYAGGFSLSIENALGNVIADNGLSSSVPIGDSFIAPENGEFFVRAAPIRTTSGAGDYVIEALMQDNVLQNTSTNAFIPVGGTVRSSIDVGVLDDFAPRDSDWFRFEGLAGETYQFSVTGDGGPQSLAQANVAVRDRFGNILDQSNSFSGTSTVQNTPEEDGNFFLSVTSTSPGNYVVSSSSTGPEVGNGLSKDDAETVALLFEAALNRDGQIGLGGLNFHIDAREAGLSEEGLAQQFLDSPEFAREFGAPDTLSDQALVEILFLNVLNRPGAEGGIDFWTDRVGDPDFTRAELLIAFAESPENRAGSPFVESLTEVTPGDWDFLTA